jgi:hypothetical protein
MLRSISIIFILSILAISCVIDKLPQISISVNNKDRLQIDSVLLTVDSSSIYKYTYKISGFNNKFNDYWMADTFFAVVYVKNRLPIKSNIVIRKTYNDDYNLEIENNKVSLIRTEESIISKWIFYLFVMFFISFGFKSLPSVLFVKPEKKEKYLIISTLINVGYCIFIFGGALLIEFLKYGEAVPTALLLIVISFIVDSLIYSYILAKHLKLLRLLSCILITNTLFYFGGIMIFLLISLMK